MVYDAFLLVMSQLAGKRKARVVVEGELIFFEETSKKDHWILSTKVFSGEGYLPPSVRAYLPRSGVLRWQQSGAYLKLDPAAHCVYLFEEITMPKGKYIPFKHHLNAFSNSASEWREIFQEKAYIL